MGEKEKILSFAEKKFSQNGFYKTTMDELSREMKISKKTIYKHYASKDELLNAVIDFITESIKTKVTKLVSKKINSVEKLYLMSVFVTKRINQISEKWLDDLRIYRPELWTKIEKFREKTIIDNIDKIIAQGKTEKYIIDKPNKIILMVIISSVQAILNPNFILNNNFSVNEAANTTLEIVFTGILTKQGRKIFKNFKSGLKNEKNI